MGQTSVICRRLTATRYSVCIVSYCLHILTQVILDGLSSAWRFTASYKWGYASPDMRYSYSYSYVTYDPTYNYP